MQIQVIVGTYSNRDKGGLELENAQALFNKAPPKKLPIFFAVKYPRSRDPAVCFVDARNLPDVEFIVYNLDWKIHDGENKVVQPSCKVVTAVVFDDDAVADWVGVVPTKKMAQI